MSAVGVAIANNIKQFTKTFVMSKLPTLQSQRIDELVGHVSKYHACFFKHVDLTSMNSGATDPYFEILNVCKQNGSASKTIDDENFFYWLERTLKAWQMNRGREGGSLATRGEMKRSMRSPEIRESIKQVESLSLINPVVVKPPVFTHIQRMMWGITVTTAESKLVANSKTLHFLLPDLVPPIDRRYTLRFFFNRDVSSDKQSDAFDEVYRQYHQIAIRAFDQLKKLVHSHRFATSEAKVIDNAIIGYCLETGLVKNAGGRKHA